MYKTIIKARYQETDKMGIVHHSVYPIWYEQARCDFINSLGISYSELEAKGVMLPLTEINCKYIKPTFFEDVVTVCTFIKHLTNVKIVFEYNIYNGDELINTGSSIHPFVDTNFKLINLKKFNLELFSIISAYKN